MQCNSYLRSYDCLSLTAMDSACSVIASLFRSSFIFRALIWLPFARTRAYSSLNLNFRFTSASSWPRRSSFSLFFCVFLFTSCSSSDFCSIPLLSFLSCIFSSWERSPYNYFINDTIWCVTFLIRHYIITNTYTWSSSGTVSWMSTLGISASIIIIIIII